MVETVEGMLDAMHRRVKKAIAIEIAIVAAVIVVATATYLAWKWPVATDAWPSGRISAELILSSLTAALILAMIGYGGVVVTRITAYSEAKKLFVTYSEAITKVELLESEEKDDDNKSD